MQCMLNIRVGIHIYVFRCTYKGSNKQVCGLQGLDIRLSHEVLKIQYGEPHKGVHVSYTGPEGKPASMDADYCVVAVPLGVSCLLETSVLGFVQLSCVV